MEISAMEKISMEYNEALQLIKSAISQQLQKELPGLRSFSATSIKKMRTFYEHWSVIINRPPLAVEIQSSDNQNALSIRELIDRYRSPLANDFEDTYSVMPEPLKKVMPDEKKLVSLLVEK